jgi:hypothetical protein
MPVHGNEDLRAEGEREQAQNGSLPACRKLKPTASLEPWIFHMDSEN